MDSNPIKHAHVIVVEMFMEIVCQLLDLTHKGTYNGFCLLVWFAVRQPDRIDIASSLNTGGRQLCLCLSSGVSHNK